MSHSSQHATLNLEVKTIKDIQAFKENSIEIYNQGSPNARIYLLISIDTIYRIMVPIASFYRILFYPITFIISPFSTNHITSCLGFCVDMVSHLDPVSMIFALSLQ